MPTPTGRLVLPVPRTRHRRGLTELRGNTVMLPNAQNPGDWLFYSCAVYRRVSAWLELPRVNRASAHRHQAESYLDQGLLGAISHFPNTWSARRNSTSIWDGCVVLLILAYSLTYKETSSMGNCGRAGGSFGVAKWQAKMRL